MSDTTTPILISRRDLQRTLGKSSETMRQWIKARRLPPFDVYVSDRECWWRPDTLAAAGFNVVAPAACGADERQAA